MADGRIFNTFQVLKTYMYFHTRLEQKKENYETRRFKNVRKPTLGI